MAFRRTDVQRIGLTALLDLLRVYTQRDHVRGFIIRHRGQRVPLAWPDGYSFVINDLFQLGLYTEEDVEMWASALCCHEKLTVFAYVSRAHEPFTSMSPLLLLGSAGRVYAVTPQRRFEICRLGDTIDGFLKRGLRRFEQIYKTLSVYCVTGAPADFLSLETRSDVLAFRDSNRGRVFSLLWPPGDTLLVEAKVESFHATDAATALEIREMTAFASFGPAHFSGAARISLYISGGGAVFAFDDNVGLLLCIASDFQQFLRLGVRAYFKSYVFSTAGYTRRRRPLCPHTPTFVMKVEPVAARDLLLAAYQREHYARGFPPSHQ